MENRVVITGIGVVSPNATNRTEFTNALRQGISGIRRFDELEEINFRCHLGGIPPIPQPYIDEFCDRYNLVKLRSTGILYGCIAGIEAWSDSGLEIIGNDEEPDWESGCIFGTSGNGMEAIEHGMKLVDKLEVRKMGGRAAQQAMNSGISAYLGGILGLGNQVTTNSSACATGTESIVDAWQRVKWGLAERVLAGSSESSSKYIWGGYDVMSGYVSGYALSDSCNDNPEIASCPMGKKMNGFIPGAGGGALVVESLSSARERGARIYAEILGGASNCGGQRRGADILRANPEGTERCISEAMKVSEISPDKIDLISGHLVSNESDIKEVEVWAKVLKRQGSRFPFINALKSMTGHCFSASGSLEVAAAALQLHDGFIHPSLNSSELHPEIERWVDSSRVPQQMIVHSNLNTVASLSCGIGDVNTCIILKKWNG